MLKIGEFAALAKISVRMLRHYDELGLLKPAQVDRETEYRYYTLEQLPRLNRILALKDLGLALGEIRLLLDEQLSAEELRGMLKLKQAQLQQHLSDERARLRRVESRLHYIELEGKLPDAEVVIKAQPALHVISLRGLVGPEGTIARLFSDCYTALQAHQLVQHIHGYLLIYHGSMEFQRTGIRAPAEQRVLEAMYVMDEAVQESITLPDKRQLSVWDIPAYAQVASLISTKPDRERHLDAHVLWQWMAQHHYRLVAPSRELYLKRPPRSDSYLTEMIFPIEPIPAEE